MKLAVGADHAGFDLASSLADWLRGLGHEVVQLGATSTERYDYPDASDLVACRILGGQADLGVLVCGTGIGVSIRANRYPGVRAAECTSTTMAELARGHNHANVLCLGSRILSPDEAKQITARFLESPEDPGDRHVKRVGKLDAERVC